VPNLGRSPLLIILVLFLFLFILLPLINRKSSSSLSDSDRALRTEQALTRAMDAEQTYFKANHRYTDHISDLIALSPKIQTDLVDGFSVQVDSSGGSSYFVQVTSPVLTFSRVVTNGKIVARTCLQLKSAGDKYCKRKTSAIQKSIPVT
jgi:hypothetical protein